MENKSNKIEKTFELRRQDYIELCNLLQLVGACQTGGQAKLEIADGQVIVDGQVETRKRCKIRKDQVIEYQEHLITVV